MEDAEEAAAKLREASGEAWEEAKEDFDTAYAALQKAIDERKQTETIDKE